MKLVKLSPTDESIGRTVSPINSSINGAISR